MRKLAWGFYATAVLAFLLACVTDNAYLAGMTALPIVIWMVLLWRAYR